LDSAVGDVDEGEGGVVGGGGEDMWCEDGEEGERFLSF
jgi:hypothetical protein